MDLSRKIDKLLATLHQLADAPPAGSAAEFQSHIRIALAELPEISKASGREDADAFGARPRRRENTTASGATTIGTSYTRWRFRGLGPSPGGGVGGAGSFGGARTTMDEPQFADDVGGSPRLCPALTSCSQQKPPDCYDYKFVWVSGLSLHAGGLVSGPEFFCTNLCLKGEFQWF